MIKHNNQKLDQIVQHDIITFLENNNELMFNERDFQMHLSTWLKHSHNAYDDIDVEYYVPYQILDNYIWKNELRLDIVVKKNGEFLPIELKYKTQSVQKILPRFDEELKDKEGNNIPIEVMKSQGAQDLGMYDFWKDVHRIELVRNRFKQVKGGLAVFVTNDKTYLKQPRTTSNNYMFRMNNGIHLKQKFWQNPNSVCAKLHPNFNLEKEYQITWNSINIDTIEFYYCIIMI